MMRLGQIAGALAVGLFSGSALAQITIHDFSGKAINDEFGTTSSIVGDVNDDGFADVIVTAVGASGPGYAQVFSGVDGALLYEVTGTNPVNEFGLTGSGAGDVDADGFNDFIVGEGDAGEVRVFSGKTGEALLLFTSVGGNGQFGASVAGVGDIDQDGYDDIAAAAPQDDSNGNDAGWVLVFSGRTGALLHSMFGSGPTAQFGRSISGTGDLNQDGYPDFIVGSPFVFSAGFAQVFSGKDGSVLYQFDGLPGSFNFGFTVSRAGDVNQDGINDVIVGGRSGYAIVFSGADGSTLHTLTGESSLGWAVSGAGDVDGDQHDDVIVAALGELFSSPGFARVFSGKTGEVLQQYNAEEVVNFNVSVAGGGDVNGDGLDDVIFGASGGFGSTVPGFARVYPGLPPGCSNTETSTDANQNDLPDHCEVCQTDLGFSGPGNMSLGICGDDLTTTNSEAIFFLRGAPPNSKVFVAVGTTQNPTAVLGGTLVPDSLVLVDDSLTTDENGEVFVTVPGRGGTPTIKYYMQAIIQVGGNFQFSNAIEVELGT